MISIQHLSKAYGNWQVLHDIHLELEKGKVYGIVGENGSGKTTLFRCIAGMEPYRGHIESNFDNLKNHLGFLPTNPVFMSHVTGWEYLKLLCMARKIEASHFERQNIFDLPLDQYAETYSTGMKKKLALMGILLQQNKVFILDEPFNGVDIHSNIMIAEIIKKLRSLGKTVLISSHIFSTLSECSDQIHLLKAGRIARSFEKDAFADLERDMKAFMLGDRIEKLVMG